jgi:protein gp37
MAKRLAGRYGYPADDPFRVTFHHDRIWQPLKWKKPRQIFVCSMGDLFHIDVRFDQIKSIIARMASPKCDHHKYLILTKRPDRMKDFFYWLDKEPSRGRYGIEWPLKNVWLGTTVENNDYIWRIAYLLRTPAAIRFVSIEPMLGPVHINYSKMFPTDVCFQKPPLLDWVIVGGESGPGARPMHPDWVRHVRDDCVSAGVPFFFKQWGEWAPVEYYDRDYYLIAEGKYGTPLKPRTMAKRLFNGVDNWRSVFPVGKKRAGRMIDGRTWDGYPDPTKGE